MAREPADSDVKPRRSIGGDVVKLTALGIGMVAVVVATSLWGFVGLHDAVEDTHRASQAIRHQMDGDMMHDALRADALAALLAESHDENAVVTRDMREHAAKFRTALAANRENALSPALAEAVAAAEPRLESYVQAAERLVTLAASDRAGAARALPSFQAEFEALEKAMSRLSDQIEGLAASYQDAATHAQSLLRWLVVGIGVLAAGLLGAIGVSLYRSVRAKEQAEREAEAKVAEMTARELEQAQQLRAHVKVLLAAVEDAARGDLTREVVVVDDGVVGQMAAGLQQFLQDLRGSMSALSTHAANLGRASDDLSGVSGQLSGSASEVASQASSCTLAARTVSESVQTVASGTMQMTASIEEISRSASEVTRITGEAVGVAHDANQIVAALGASSNEVGNVVKLITQIANQTKMLSLNATIEAARAGEAGRGFAVVANEVSELAKRTSNATGDIHQRIEAIQRGTEAAVANIHRVAELIERVNTLQLSIAAAIEEQTVTANEMSRHVTEGARGASQISDTIAGVARAAGDASSNATRSADASRELAGMAVELRTLVARYRLTADAEAVAVAAPPARPRRASLSLVP